MDAPFDLKHKNFVQMKYSIVALFFWFFAVPHAFSQADRVVGVWLTEKGDSQVQIYRNTQGKYWGKIVWMGKDIDALDEKNPDEKLKARKILGMLILGNFTYNAEEQEWRGGSIYDPESGKTYDCYMWLDADNILKVKGYVLGMRFLSRQTTWKREKSIRTLTK
jgi:uncharacterized protein (DUF2147 family)